MRLHVIGLGGAGCRIVDGLAAEHDGDRLLQGLSAFDTDMDALGSLRHLDDDRRYRFGDAAGGDGLGGDLHAGRRLGTAHADELTREMDDERPSIAEAFLLVVGLGGAAGAGAAPALAEELDRLYDAPTYALGVLPARGETDPRTTDQGRDESPPRRPLADKNAARTLDALSARVDAVFPFDNDSWVRADETIADAAPRVNAAIVERIVALFGAGEAGDDVSTPQQVLDASDVARAVGSDGEIAAIGYATQGIEPPESGSRFGFGLFGSSKPAEVDTSAAVSAVETVIRKAARGKGSIEVPEGRADRTLLVVGGPPAWLNRTAIADGRRWLAQETGSDAILSGDAPNEDRDDVFAVVLRSGIDDTERLSEIRASIE
ncbi:cell division protein FtsZ [Halorubrum sp. DTA98]|uniref:cell division protein FtsZ n=1 Tax=Halorubrum sp. DTA98 TaxID=3402163 RepID=UPI003AAC8550